METIQTPGVLNDLLRKLASSDQTIGEYVEHSSTGKGITLRTSRGSLFLYHSFIHKLISQPETVTEPELRQLIGTLK